VGLVYDPRGLPGVTTVRPGMAGVLHCQWILFIPEECHPTPPMSWVLPYMDPEDIIYHDLLDLYYHVFIDILEVEDWSPPSESSIGSDTSTDGISGSRVCGFSHPYPKRVRLAMPESSSQLDVEGASGHGGEIQELAAGFSVGDLFIP
jgi:hypothetical protein